jgi:hypothetical protein
LFHQAFSLLVTPSGYSLNRKSLLVGFQQEILIQFWWEVKRLLANIEGVEQLAVSF